MTQNEVSKNFFCYTPKLQNLNPEKLPWKESRKHVKSIAEKLQKCYGVCTASEEDTCLLITDTLLIGLNETCLSNCQVIRAEWPFIPRYGCYRLVLDPVLAKRSIPSSGSNTILDHYIEPQ